VPISITTKEPKADVPFAQSPEFAKLQDAINQAKEALDDVSRQIVAIESKLNPTARPNPNGRPGGDDIAKVADALGAPQPDTAPGPKPGPGPMEPHPGYPTSYDQSTAPAPATSGDYPEPASQSPARRARPSFEEAIEDMRRIAGLR